MSWFLISLIPVSNALPVPGVQILAERWLYLPSVGACALGGWGAWILYRRTRRWMRPGWALVSAIVLLLFGVRTFLWCYSWRSKESLARTMVASAPDEPLGYTNLGVALVEKGKVEEAVGEYRKAIQLKPDFFQAHYNLGNALWHQGKAEEAIAEYRRAVSLDPDFAQAYFNLGLALGERGKVEEAIVAYRRAVQLKPDYAQAHYNLGVTLGQQGKAEEAMAEYRHAIELLPDYAQALENLAAMLDVQGQRKEAKGYWERALESEKRPEWLGLIRTRLAETN
jgi:tetratricopeptide (TPR) repeat protein